MKSRLFVFAFLLFVCAAPLLAQQSGSSANGRIEYDSGGSPALLQFRAHLHDGSGPVDGQIKFDGTVDSTAVSVTVTLDCAFVTGNQAYMTGPITDASDPLLIGSRSYLSVEDNGQGNNSPPDRFTFVLVSGAECHTLILPSQDVPSGHVHVKASNAPF
jgi:hypothetical protein